MFKILIIENHHLCRKILLSFIVLLFLLSNSGYPTQSVFTDEELARVDKEAYLDAAYVHYRGVLYQDNNPAEKNRAMFALGEYFYLIANYQDAQQYFNEYLKNSSDLSTRIFALVYLLDIAQKEKKEGEVQTFQEGILNLEQQLYLFRDNKTYQYKSPLNRLHRAVYTIDEVKVYVDNQLFFKTSY